jgi:hypothetical protein
MILAHLAKGNVSFCRHLASIVCHLLTLSKRMTDDGHQVMAKAHIAFGKVC